MLMVANIAVKLVSMYEEVLNYLPYKSSFLFVDTITSLDESGVVGEYTLKPDSFFYEDHFPGYPVTPGAIIAEIMAQIGLVVLGIYLIIQSQEENHLSAGKNIFPLLTLSEVEFYKMVLPGEKIRVISKKQYFRFNKLKCGVEMLNEKNETVAKGVFAGIIKESNIKDAI
jgi:3-hydroxyacyl-[acyl-carrier-protein] dehydratase